MGRERCRYSCVLGGKPGQSEDLGGVGKTGHALAEAVDVVWKARVLGVCERGFVVGVWKKGVVFLWERVMMT